MMGKQVMVFKVVWLGILVCFTSMASALSYSDFPPDLQLILNDRIASLNSGGGICIAGRVTFSDGAPIHNGGDVKVNFYNGIDEPLRIYDGGWFIMIRKLSSYYAGANKGFILRAFGYDAIDAKITVLNGQMTYVEFQMIETPPENLASITGIVRDQYDQSFDNAYVSLGFPSSSLGSTGEPTWPDRYFITGPDGTFSFNGLSKCEYSLVASSGVYAYDAQNVTPPAGGTYNRNLWLYPPGQITIEYVYQANGTRNFTGGNLEMGTIEWEFGSNMGMDFSDGIVKCCGLGRDINLEQQYDALFFINYYGNGNGNGSNGFYDVGRVDFASVTQASIGPYTLSQKPCKLGHVYVVKTCDELYYAKFVIRAINGVCPLGDFDRNHEVTPLDLTIMANHWLEGSPLVADLNHNAVIDTPDLVILAECWLHPGGVGDFNGDVSVNLADFALMATQWGLSQASCDANNNWCDRTDLNHSGVVNFADLAQLAENWLEVNW